MRWWSAFTPLIIYTQEEAVNQHHNNNRFPLKISPLRHIVVLELADHGARPSTECTMVSEEPPTESEVLVCIQELENGKSGGDDGISAEMLKFLSSGIRKMTEI
ncbi:hypothetical protein RB195_018355 [Necator americanus]|uniref:Uncharacterized protein n=1 Tax=Necator americanus TaxID=51031 RepID=A0ABR1CBP3_NECAM